MIRLPYGISHFGTLIRDGYHYVDRTSFLAQLEQLNEKYLFFLRARRFGKTLFVSMLRHYYGREHAARFDDLFGQFHVGQNPTPLANQYLILAFEFSGIDTENSESTFTDFLENVRDGVDAFVSNYSIYFSADESDYILEATAPNMMLTRLFVTFRRNRKRVGDLAQIYLFIDEYDHFANELVAFHFSEFKRIVGRNGFVRKFYERIKTATGEGLIDRIFITGVSPLTLDSLTSGFNIGTNITLDPNFHDLLGFTPDEMEEILRGIHIEPPLLGPIIEDLTDWYDGYLFHPDIPRRIYNPDMVLYFANQYFKLGRYPERMLDTNIASDYTKVRQLFRIDNQEEHHLVILEDVTAQGSVTGLLTEQFSLVKGFSQDDLVSLLFYMGLLTIKERQFDDWTFVIPNLVIEQLYFEYFRQIILEQSGLNTDERQLRDRIIQLAQENDIAPLIEIVESILRALSNRDAMGFDEKYVKAIFASLFYTTQIYTIHSEFEVDRRFVDLVLTHRPNVETNYQFAIELKYLKKSEASRLKAVHQEGRDQLTEYLQHEKLRAIPNLKAWLIVIVGTEAQVVEMVGL